MSRDNQESKKLAQRMADDFRNTERFKEKSMSKSVLDCIFRRKSFKMRQEAVSRVTKELDIERVMHRLRLSTFVSLGLLKAS